MRKVILHHKPLFFIFVSFCFLACVGSQLPAAKVHETAGKVVLTGIEVLAQSDYRPLWGLRVGLITNHTGVSNSGVSTIDLLFQSDRLKLVSLFSPEHGIRGVEDSSVDSGKDEKTGLPIYSLYGKTLKPTPAMLANLDALVFDIQDIGTRYYTYIGTLAFAMQAAQENRKKFFVLDRPNPINGFNVQGAIPPARLCGGVLTCIYPIPTRHGMTVGEVAQLLNEQMQIGSNLQVISMQGWKRSMYWEETGLLWIHPSPNMKTVNGALLYPGPGALEDTQLSVGRGLSTPFEIYGAPFFNSEKILTLLSKRNLPGVRFESASFIPTAKGHQFEGKLCHGIRVRVIDREVLNPILLGLHLLQVFFEADRESGSKKYFPNKGFVKEIGDDQVWQELTVKGVAPEQIIDRWQGRINSFLLMREKYLLY